jgi:hypothetical protein
MTAQLNATLISSYPQVGQTLSYNKLSHERWFDIHLGYIYYCTVVTMNPGRSLKPPVLMPTWYRRYHLRNLEQRRKKPEWKYA